MTKDWVSEIDAMGGAPGAVVKMVDEIAADVLKTAEADVDTPEGFVEGVEALKAAIAAALGVGTEG